MSHFYGTIHGRRNGESTRCGEKSSGLTTLAASWKGNIRVNLQHDHRNGVDLFSVEQTTWQGAGVYQLLARGVIGQPVIEYGQDFVEFAESIHPGIREAFLMQRAMQDGNPADLARLNAMAETQRNMEAA